MPELYREIVVEAIMLAFLGGGLIFIPLYINMHTISLHILGPNWDTEVFVYGVSMYPTLKIGDFICVAEVDPLSIKADSSSGDIIVFQRPNASILHTPMLVAHRAINKTTRNGITYFETKGDNDHLPDQWVDYRGENYTWNYMVSEVLLQGKVIGIRKNYAEASPVTVMTMSLVGVVAADIAISAFLIHRNADSKAADNKGKQSV